MEVAIETSEYLGNVEDINLIVCSICLYQVALDPFECKSCITCFCKSHLASLKIVALNAELRVTSQKSNQKVEVLVQNLEFKCNSCSQIFKYQQSMKHRCPVKEKVALDQIEKEREETVQAYENFKRDFSLSKERKRERQVQEQAKLQGSRKRNEELFTLLALKSHENRRRLEELEIKLDKIKPLPE